MAYERTNWNNGDVISSEKLNKMEAGIEYACSLEHEVEDPTEGQVLKYDAEKEKFVNSDVPAAIETNIQNPTDGQTLKYDAASGKWVNGEGGSAEPFLIHLQNDGLTLDKTWREIYDVYVTGRPVFISASEEGYIQLRAVLGVTASTGSESGYEIETKTDNYETNSENGYPVFSV